ncbi:MAG: radical SAM protein [Butyrivibrio sp.]|nr:radical SAM protein [Butyrivibrio sp.]
MKIARILYPVHVLGPGERIGIWTYGCPHACKGCANPELWNPAHVKETDEQSLRAYLEQLSARGAIDGITITGGDPFYDKDSLRQLLKIVSEWTEDILVYTGYQMEELLKWQETADIMKGIAVLIDGPYVEGQNNGHVLKGSDNQTIYYLKDQYKEKYESYINKHSGKFLVENFPAKDGTISVGIHKPDFREKIQESMEGGRHE